MPATSQSRAVNPADFAINDEFGRGEPETFGNPHRSLVLRMHVCDEALYAPASEPRCHSDGGLASTSSTLIPAGDHPRELRHQAFAFSPQGRLNYAHSPAGCAVTYDPVQPTFLTIRRPSRRLPPVAVAQLTAGRGPTADVAMQHLIVKEGSHLGSVINSQRLQPEARRFDHIGRRPFWLDQHLPTLSRTAAQRPTAGRGPRASRAHELSAPGCVLPGSRPGGTCMEVTATHWPPILTQPRPNSSPP